MDPNSFGAIPVGSAAIEDVLNGRPASLTLFDGHAVLASREALRRARIAGPRRFGSRSAIAVGYRADLTAFAASPLSTPSADLPGVPVTLTMVDGIIRHRAT